MNSTRPFLSPQAFKAHLHDVPHWTHVLIKMYSVQLYEAKPDHYQDNAIEPIRFLVPNSDDKHNTQKSVLSVSAKKHATIG